MAWSFPKVQAAWWYSLIGPLGINASTRNGVNCCGTKIVITGMCAGGQHR